MSKWVVIIELEPRNSDNIVLSNNISRVLENGNVEIREEINTIGEVDLSEFMDMFIGRINSDPSTDINFKSVMIKIEQVI